jgi:hypothetical protein
MDDNDEGKALFSSADVPMFQYNPANTRATPDATGPGASVSEQWTVDVGCIVTAPAVVDGIIDDAVYIGGGGTVYALYE